MKTYRIDHALVPREWLAATGAAAHRQQCDLVVIAPTKKAITDLLIGAGIHDRIAAGLARQAQLDGGSTSVANVTAAGIVDPTVTAIYGWWSPINNVSIIRLDGTTPTVIGRWRYISSAGGVGSLIAEKVPTS